VKQLRLHECAHPPGKNGGGAESGLRDEVRASQMLGHEVAWLHSGGPGSVRRAIREYAPDVIHIGTIHNLMGIECGEAALDSGVPVVWHLHDYWPFCRPRMLLRREDESCPAVEGTCDNCCGLDQDGRYLGIVNRATVVAGNRYTAAIMRRNGVRVDAVVESGVDTDAFHPTGESLPSSVCCSNAWGAQNLIKGTHVAKRAVNGDGWVLNVITGLPRDDVPAALRRFGIYVNASVYEETFCLALCEAMATGLACVASDVAGAKAQIEDGVTGLLFPNRDHLALRECVNRLRADPALRDRLGRAAREHVLAEHTLLAMGIRWERVYERVLAEVAV
jgi:glycosyltransferase involved in cell wall biosynthesis